jgi:antitoxin CptB
MRSAPDDPPRLKRLRFRSWRRGFREADLLIGGFADAHLHEFDAAQLDRFEALLAQDDHLLFGWIVGRSAPPPEFDHDVMARLRGFRPAPPAAG